MKPTVWGPKFWQLLHILSYKYPSEPSDNDKKQMKLFLENLYFVIPCKECSEHFKQNIRTNPITDSDLSSKYSFIRWIISFHNIVNVFLKKEIFPYDVAIINLNNATKNINYVDDLLKTIVYYIFETNSKNTINIKNFIDCIVYFEDSRSENYESLISLKFKIYNRLRIKF